MNSRWVYKTKELDFYFEKQSYSDKQPSPAKRESKKNNKIATNKSIPSAFFQKGNQKLLYAYYVDSRLRMTQNKAPEMKLWWKPLWYREHEATNCCLPLVKFMITIIQQ